MDPSVFNLTSSNLDLCQQSLVIHNDLEYGLVQTKSGLRLAVLAATQPGHLESFQGEVSELKGQNLLVGPLNTHNANALRANHDWLKPKLLGLHTSIGMGDRLGVATPGHVRAARHFQGKFSPIFAQQSMREMSRTVRTPQQVMDDATWGIFQEGWQAGVGADADHLKTTADIDACLDAGFTLFTIDPGSFVDQYPNSIRLNELRQLAEKLPTELQPRASSLMHKTFKIENLELHFDEATLLKAAIKYGRALAHVAVLSRHLAQVAGPRPYEMEISIDETDYPTSHAEHVYIVHELRRLGVQWVSLAPRFLGRFEKGVDYIGDLLDFESDFAGHAAIAREFGPYKLSLHSGSDKFSIYPIAMHQTKGMMHLKTAGTSYLEALRTIALLDCNLLREIYAFSRERYDVDKISYHVSADLARAPFPGDVIHWPELLDHFDARQILHVSFGSVLSEKDGKGQRRFYNRLMELLEANPERYETNLENHFKRHLESLFCVP